MKLWKRLTATAVALTMSASVWALAACGGPNQGGNSGNGGNQNQEDDQGKNPGNQGGTNGADVSAIVTALKEQQLVSANLKLTMEEHDEAEYTYNDADGTKIADYYTYSSDSKSSMEVALNAATCDMDAVMFSDYTSTTHFENVEYGNYFSKSQRISYMFLRDWNMFTYNVYDSVDKENDELEVEEVTDWSDVVLEYQDKVTEGMPEDIPAEALGMLVSHEPAVNILLLNLASAADAVKVESGKATIDINKLVDNALSDANSALQGFTDKTTIGELLDNAVIAKYLSAIFNIFTVDEVKELLELYLTGSGMEEVVNPILEAVQPDENSTTYQYIVKLVKSAELYSLVSGMLDGMIELPEGTLSNIALGFIMQVVLGVVGDGEVVPVPDNAAMAIADAEEGFDYLALAKAYVSELSKQITATELKIKSVGYCDGYTGDYTTVVSFKNFKMEYVLNADNTIASQTVSFDGIQEGVENVHKDYYYSQDSGEDIMVYGVRSGTSTISLEASIEYNSIEAALIDISDCTVEYTFYVLKEGTYDEYWNEAVYSPEYGQYIDVSLNIYTTVRWNGQSVSVEKGGVVYAREDGQEFTYVAEMYNPENPEEPIKVSVHLQLMWEMETNSNGDPEFIFVYIRNLDNGDTYRVADVQPTRFDYFNTVGGILNGEAWWEINN